MSNCNVIKKLFLIIFGLLIFFLLLESSLRISSFLYLKSHSVEYSKNKDDNFDIVCIGDSFTMGVGASTGEDYPSQLEKALNSGNKRLKFRIINAGIGGATTSTVLNSLNEMILKYRPAMFILIVGCNDRWNYTSLNLSGLRKNQIPFTIKINSLLFNFKSYKLLRIIMVNLKSKIDQMIEKKEYKYLLGKMVYKIMPDKIRHAFTEKAAKHKEDDYLRLGSQSYKQHRLEEAIIYLKKALEINPVNGRAYEYLAHIYRERDKDSREVLDFTKKALEMNYGDSKIQESLYMQLMCLYNHQKIYDPDTERILEKNKDYSDYNKLIGKFYKLDKKQRDALLKRWGHDNNKDLDIRKNIFITRESLIDRVISFNLNLIARICKDNKINLVFCSYPEYVIPHMEEVSQKYGISFIDLTSVFRNHLQSGEREDYFVPDNHCNANGYRIMAETISERILNETGL